MFPVLSGFRVRCPVSLVPSCAAVLTLLLTLPVAGQSALATVALAGQSIAVLPVTMVVPEGTLPSGAGPPATATERRAWADSLVAEALTERSPEVTWVFPPALRRMARRNPGFVKNPDDMGQAVLRSPGLKTVPDPLRSSLRGITAVAGGRYVLVLAAVLLTPGDSTGAVRATLTAVLTDTRTAAISWRTTLDATGETATAAFRAALARMLPFGG